MATQRADKTPTAVQSAVLPSTMVGLSLTNRVVHRTLLVPMKDYTFFISQFVTFAYVAVYGTILYRRKQLGIVTDEMLQFAREKWRVFAVIGALEALTFAIQLYTGARIPGALIGVLSQGILPSTMVLSALFRGKTYTPVQILGAAVMIAGVITTIYPTFSALPSSLGWQLVLNSGLYFASTGFIATALVLKESTLQTANLDVFVVNTMSSFMQMIGTILLMPFSFAIALGGLDVVRSQQYFSSGLRALAGLDGLAITPYLFLAYIAANLSMNILGLTLIKRFSAVTALLTSFVTVPLVTLVFCLDLPLLTKSQFSPIFLMGILIVLIGLALYNSKFLVENMSREKLV